MSEGKYDEAECKKTGVQILAFVLIPGLLYLAFLLLRPKIFGNLHTLTMLMMQSIISFLLAWRMSFNMTAGNIDFSLGAEVIMGTLIGAIFAKKMGVAGIVLGAIITKGQSLIIMSDQTILGKTPWNIIIFLVMGSIMYYLQKYSVYGAHCRALGGNAGLAENAGIKKSVIYGKAIMIASGYCAVAAVLSLSNGAGAAASTGMNSMSTVFSAMIGVFIAIVLEKYINIVFGIFSGVLAMNIMEMSLDVVQWRIQQEKVMKRHVNWLK